MATNKKTRSSSSTSRKAGQRSLASSLIRLFFACLIWLIILCVAAGITVAAVGAIAYATGYKNIPDVQRLTEYEPKLPLRIFTADGILLAEYSEEKREFVPIDQIPQILRDSLLAVEDSKFYEHIGIDYKGLVRATLVEVFRPEGMGRQGASTITMQLARNFFLTNERTYIRKFYEILTTLRIESTLTKDQILEIYMNQIFLGHRSYGFAAAAKTYYGKTLNELTIAESAMLAGLPQAPSNANPISFPQKARARQLHVLGRMKETGVITQEQYDQAVAEPVVLRPPKPLELQIHAEHAADQAQQMILEQFKSEAYTNGINVYTTIQSSHQKAAYHALRNGIIAYDKRHFYRGPEGKIVIPATEQELQKVVTEARNQVPDNEELQTAIVLSVSPKEVIATRDGIEKISITDKGLEPVKTGLAANARPEIKIEVGSIIRIHQRDEKNWDITQIPEVEGSLVSLDPVTGAIYAMVGGFDYARSKFNHATQAWRQPGSSFKPFVYSAALERGITPNTVLNDAPIIVRLPSGPWTPKNFGSGFAGRVPLTNAFAYSRNIPAVLVVDAITPEYAQQWITRFGFDASKHPANLSMVLGTGSVTPLQMTAAYAVFANGGNQVKPYLIARITDSKGNTLYEHPPGNAASATRAIPERNAYVMDTLLQLSGSSARRTVGRSDVYGKTGTTNDSRDAWFVGFHPTLAASVWVGYDQPKTLGRNEIGNKIAVPIWAEYMKTPLKDLPNHSLRRVQGVTTESGNSVYVEFVAPHGVAILGDELSPRPEDIQEITPETQGNILDMFR